MMILRVFALLLVVVLSANAAPLPSLQRDVERWCNRNGKPVQFWLERKGVTNTSDEAAITAAWEENVIVGVILRTDNTALAISLHSQPLARTNYDKLLSWSLDGGYWRITDQVLRSVPAYRQVGSSECTNVAQHLKADGNLRRVRWEILASIVSGFPPAVRESVRATVRPRFDVAFSNRPAWGALVFEKLAMTNSPAKKTPEDTVIASATAAELLPVLLAGEPCRQYRAEHIKRALLKHAQKLSVAKLRAAGQPFIVRDGVNPLVAELSPVVEALNAGECAGLEPALRNLGATVPSVDRSPLRQCAARWRAKLLAGGFVGEASDPKEYLGTVAIQAGVTNYNAIIDVYNNGSNHVDQTETPELRVKELTVPGIGAQPPITGKLPMAPSATAARVANLQRPDKFMTDMEIWDGGPLGQLRKAALKARARGDEAGYAAASAKYWRLFAEAVARRISPGLSTSPATNGIALRKLPSPIGE